MLSVPMDSKGKRLFHWHQVKVAHNNPQIPLFQFHRLLRHFEWTGCWVNGDFTLTHRFHTFLNIFLNWTRKKKKKKASKSWQDLSHYFRAFCWWLNFLRAFPSWCFPIWPLLSTKSDLLAFYLSKLHPVRANIFVSMMDSLVWSERERKRAVRSEVL